MTVALISPRHFWYCPNCDHKDVTEEARPHTRFHACSGLRGLTAPMLPAGTKAKVSAHEREDYIGNERVFLHDGRPVMSITTERDDGQDVVVFAPTANGRAQELD